MIMHIQVSPSSINVGVESPLGLLFMPSLTGHIFRPCRGVGFRPVRRRGESSDQGRLVSFTVIQTMALIAGIDTTLWFPSGVGFPGCSRIAVSCRYVHLDFA